MKTKPFAYLISSSGSTTDLNRTSPFSLKELQDLVGGYIEMVPLDDGLLVVDEDGKLREKPINVGASRLLRAGYSDWVAGDAVWCSKDLVE